ncbi:MAG TPA: S8 family serine peptidase, partial [Thermoanaerobaculia bacterium]|nr:S8 family serine peptidase [Thermoanaerobaculia bacterium]
MRTSVVLLAFALPLAAQNGTRSGRIIPSPVGESGNYIVEFRDAPRLASSTATTQRFAAFESDLRSIDAAARITQRYSRVFSGAAVAASSDAIDRIAALDYVRSIHLDRPMHALLDDSLAKINAPQVWASFGTRGEGVVVAIVDTGIDYNHPAFGGGFGPGHRVAGGWDFVNSDADPMDDAGHGTHVAGIVGGNGGGVTGIAPGVTFLAYKVLDSQGSGNESVILAGIERAVADRANVVNMSLGGPAVADDPLVKAVENATAAGVVFAIAAGNNSDFRNISSPAIAPSAIAVGATTIDDQIASFSSKGPDDNLAIKPEVVAPGVNIVSAKAGGGTLSESGTSMATPHIAGVAALLRAIHPAWTPADVKAAIVGTAVPLGNDVMAEGAGRVDALAAATADVLASPSTVSFGLDVQSLPHWVSTQTVTVVNRGAAPETLQLRASSTRTDVAANLDAAT